MFVAIMLLSGLMLFGQPNITVKDSIYMANIGRGRPIKAIIKTSPFAIFYWQIPLTGEYRLAGEIMTGKKQSFQLGASYLTRSLFFAITQKMQANNGGSMVAGNGYRIQAAYKYYVFNKMYRPEGIFIAFHSSYASIRYNFKDYPNDYQTLQHFNINLLIGGQVIIANRLSLEVFFGPGYKNNLYTDYTRAGYGVFDFDQNNPSLNRHFKFSLGMNMGVAL